MDIPEFQTIQVMLTPAIMISACGLLILGMNNKYSLVMNRVRTLGQERRALRAKVDLQADETARLASIDRQLKRLEVRLYLDRNTVLAYSLAVAFFVLDSLALGLHISFETADLLTPAALGFFLLGMLSVFVGVVFALREAWYGYGIVIMDVEDEQPPASGAGE